VSGLAGATGTGLLLRQAFRRDRIASAAWIAVLVLMAYASAAATTSLYPTAREEATAVELINGQAGLRALYGPIVGTANPGALAMSKMTVLYAFFASLMFVFLVRRHTRVEEESGRSELVGGTCVGRQAPLVAAIAESMLIACLLGCLCALAAMAGGLSVAGSLCFGLSWIGTGLVATAVAAVGCQMSSSARACAAMTVGALGALFVVRAIGDATSVHALTWLSPFGWNTQLRAWSHPHLWVLLLYPALAFALLAIAQALRARRDLGTGVLRPRAGAEHAPSWLGGIPSLTVKLHLSMMAAWTLVVLAVDVFFGAVAPGLDKVLENVMGRAMIRDLGGSLMVAILTEVAVITGCFAVTIVTHAAGDELAGRAELQLATAQSRRRWYAAVAGTAGLGSLWLLVVAGLGMWLGYGLAGGADPSRALAAAVVWLPAVWIVAALALLLFAIDATWAVAAWAWPFAFLVLALVPPLLKAPGWVADLSPYQHVPKVPLEAMSWTPELLLAAAAIALGAAAWWRLASRDVA